MNDSKIDNTPLHDTHTDESSFCGTGEFTIFTASEQKAKLLDLLRQMEETQQRIAEISLAHITEIDTAGLQLLLLAKREAASAQKQLVFVGHSDAVLDLLQLSDLTGQLGDPIVVPSKH